jgi:hypothetical protein
VRTLCYVKSCMKVINRLVPKMLMSTEIIICLTDFDSVH